MLKDLLQRYSVWKREKDDISNIKYKMSQCDCDLVQLSRSQKSDIQKFYNKIGHDVPTLR